MRKLTTAVLTVLLINLGAQEFKYSGYIKSSSEVGLQNVPVKLMGRRISVYDIAQPTYTTAVAYNAGTAIPSSDDVVSGALPIGFTFNFFGWFVIKFSPSLLQWIYNGRFVFASLPCVYISLIQFRILCFINR